MMMNISSKKQLIIRFFINPISLKPPNPNPLISSPSLSSSINPPIHNTNHTYFLHRCFSVASENNNTLIPNQNIRFMNTHMRKKPYVSPQLVSKLIDIVRNRKGECRSELNSMNLRLSKGSICEIIRVLSCEKVPALQFFEWVRDNNRDNNPSIYRNADICSLMIDNCGWVNDYDTMRALLKVFKHECICLNEQAFGFLPVLDSSKVCAMECVSVVVGVLSGIGGSVCGSGVYYLISMLCGSGCFELAKYVIEITERKSNYYGVIVRELCRRRLTDDAYALIKQMRVEDCEPECKLYNYVLGSLCKMDKLSEAISVVEEMKEAGVDPDEITFEIFIVSACKLGRMEFANESFDSLIKTGLRPRFSTYAAIVKGYFYAERYDEAYAFVCDIEAKKMPAVNKMFGLLAWLHHTKGRSDVAGRILNEMMEKGLKPDFLYYAKTVSELRVFGDKDLARDLETKVTKFRVE